MFRLSGYRTHLGAFNYREYPTQNRLPPRQNITPFIWFSNEAERAVRFYGSVLKNAKILKIARYTQVGLGKPGSVMTIKFQIFGE